MLKIIIAVYFHLFIYQNWSFSHEYLFFFIRRGFDLIALKDKKLTFFLIVLKTGTVAAQSDLGKCWHITHNNE
jgi:hypothetical protein